MPFRKSLAALTLVASSSIALAQASAPATAPAEQPGRAVAVKLADEMLSGFVFPETGQRYADTLRANAAAGKYDGISGKALGEAMTKDLLEVYPDGHVRVLPESELAAPRPAPAASGTPAPVRKAPPPNVEAARWLAPGIAFIRFNLFSGDADEVAATAAFMRDHASAKVLIFDLRTHRGGGLGEMDAIFPWLFAKPTRLVTMATRKSVAEAGGSPLDGLPSLRTVTGDPAFVSQEHWAAPGKDRRLQKARVYLLTSSFTASAAEHFALAMKSTGRGVLVGEATAGANHFGSLVELGNGMAAFVPVGRTFDPKTGKDWEGSGVAPDVVTKPEDALAKVLAREGLAPEKAAALSAEVAPDRPMSRPRPTATGS